MLFSFRRLLLVFGVSCSLVGCSTMRDSVLVGTAVGAGMGVVGGVTLNSESRGSGALIGGLIGAAVGALGGVIFHKVLEGRDDQTRRETLFNLDKFNIQGPSKNGPDKMGDDWQPRISNPEVDFDWIDTHVDGKKLIEGHRVWRITEEPQWITEEAK